MAPKLRRLTESDLLFFFTVLPPIESDGKSAPDNLGLPGVADQTTLVPVSNRLIVSEAEAESQLEQPRRVLAG